MTTRIKQQPWDPIAQPIDRAVMGGRLTPGLLEIVGANSPRAWDEREGYGLSGAIVFFHGLKLSHFSLKLRLYSAQDWADWRTFKPIVDKPPIGRRALAIDIAHPLLEDLGIRSIVVEDVLAAEQTDHGEWTVEIKVIEYRRPLATMAKPDGSTATAADPVEQQIEANTATIAELLAG